MDDLVKEALRVVMVAEKKSRRWFGDAANSAPEGYGKTVLERLADQERSVIDEFGRRYGIPVEGGEDEKENQQQFVKGLQERRLLEVLQLGLHDKYHDVLRYQAYLDAFREPAICEIFETALASSQTLLEQVAEEYAQAELKLRRPVPNRRTKRTHIRPEFTPMPPANKHSQLFISLLDCGRRPLQG